ncbi:MAG: hypothetical protein FWC29_02945, partial [Methanomassiliicoccaceae archaeon]|nr:hypothetical protein [Methanomassiliicoccaceae archaeon]
ASGNGNITPSGTISLRMRANYIFTITPNPGATILDVIVDGVSVGVVTSYTFSDVTSDHTIKVIFSTVSVSSYYVKGIASEGVSMSPSGSLSVSAGGNQTISWTVMSGYRVSEVIVDGVSRPDLVNAGSYTFTDVRSNHSISVTAIAGGGTRAFLEVTVVGGNGYVEYSINNGNTYTRYTSPVELPAGTDIILHGVCSSGYEIDRWQGTLNGTGSMIFIDNITGNVTETLVLEGKSSGGGGFGDGIFGLSWLIIAIIAILLILLLAGLLLILLAGHGKGNVDVVIFNTSAASFGGKNKAHKNKPYKFSIEGAAITVSYRTGDNMVWKEPIQNGDMYEIPKEDVTDYLTVKMR